MSKMSELDLILTEAAHDFCMKHFGMEANSLNVDLVKEAMFVGVGVSLKYVMETFERKFGEVEQSLARIEKRLKCAPEIDPWEDR